MLDYPIRETDNRYRFISVDGENLGEIRFKQAVIKEYIEFIKKNENEQLNYMVDFILSSYKFTIKDKIFSFFSKKYQPRKLLKLTKLLQEKNNGKVEVIKVIEMLMGSKFKQHKTIFDESTITKDKKGTNNYIPSLSVKSICKEFNIEGPEELINNYTYEQYERMLEAMIFENNESSDEGKTLNKMALNKSKKSEVTSDEIRDRLPSKFKK